MSLGTSSDLESYVITALWSEELEQFDITDLSSEARHDMEADILEFWRKVEASDITDEDLYPHDNDEIMHDFFLTRGGAGSGFWDGDYEETLGERLSAIAHDFPPAHLEYGEDGLIEYLAM